MVKNGLILTCFATVMAMGMADNRPRRVIENEDLRFIHEWQKSQRYADLASALALNSDQIGQLKAMRQEVDRIKAEFESQSQTVNTQLEAAAKDIRQRLEAGGPLEDTDRDQLKSIRDQLKRIKREERLRLGLAVLDIGTVLSEEQVHILKSTVARHLDRAKHRSERSNASEKAGSDRTSASESPRKNRLAERFGKASQREGRHRAGAGARLARILLSDEFLKNLG